MNGADLIEEVDNGGSLLSRYVFDSDIDEPLATLRGGTWKFYQALMGYVPSRYRYDLSTTGSTRIDQL